MAKAYLIEIVHNGGKWSFLGAPTTVKHSNSVKWFCRQGPWTVHFKRGVDGGGNPLPDNSPIGDPAQDDFNGPQGDDTTAVGGDISNRTKKKEKYSYGVTVDLGAAGGVVGIDPDIVIDDNPNLTPRKRSRQRSQSGAGRGKKKTARKAAPAKRGQRNAKKPAAKSKRRRK